MEVSEVKSSSYALGPPWSFKGSALYQLHLVKAETARAFVPKDLKLVQAFGYTLGGFFLAQYDDSPAGIFDELVVIAGLVWNPPTSCAWAGRVLVNSHEACRHGQKEVGLPSHVGLFSKKTTRTTGKPIHGRNGFLDLVDVGSAETKIKKHTEIQVSEIKDGSLMALCNISLPFVFPKLESDNKWMGPRIRMSLPNYSGQTIYNSHLLKYSCQLECRVRVVEAAKISATTKIEPEKCSTDIKSIVMNKSEDLSVEDNAWNQTISVLLSKPILALEFNLLKMQVDMPTIVDTNSNKTLTGSRRIE